MSRILESFLGKLRVRFWLCILMLVANFLLVYGAIQAFNHGGSPAMYYLGLVGTVILVLVLAFPNTEAVPAEGDSDPMTRN